MPTETDYETGTPVTTEEETPDYDETSTLGNDSVTEEVDRDTLEDGVQSKLDEVFGDENDDPEIENDTTAEGGDDSEDTPEETDEADEPEESEDVEEAAAEEETVLSDDAPTLPDAYRRSLYAYGWKDSEINQNLSNLGDSFIKTAERIHENRNAELQTWADAGRKARNTEGGEEESKSEPTTQQNQQAGVPKSLSPVDAAKLKEQYGEDELIDAIVGPVNATIESLNQILPQVQQGHQAVQQAEISKVSQQVDEFFQRDTLSSYSDLYGTSSDNLTEEQLEARNKVLDTASDLMVGASSLRDQQLALPDALDYAHGIVSKDFTDTAVRKGLKKQAKQRNRGISQKPSRRRGGQSKGDDGRPQSREELARRTKDRMKAAFNE